MKPNRARPTSTASRCSRCPSSAAIRFGPWKSIRVGTALVETVVLITLTALLSGMIVTGMAALLRVSHSLTDHQVGQTALQQMAEILRKDMHRATSCQWDQESQILVMRMPEQSTVKYFPRNQRWVRVLTVDSDPPVTTSFGVNDSFRGVCQESRVDQGELIHWVLMNRPLPQPQPEKPSTRRTLQSEIVAVVGRDHRWSDEIHANGPSN